MTETENRAIADLRVRAGNIRDNITHAEKSLEQSLHVLEGRREEIAEWKRLLDDSLAVIAAFERVGAHDG